MSKHKSKRPTAPSTAESTSANVVNPVAPSPVRSVELRSLSGQYLAFFDVTLPSHPGADTASPTVVQVRRLTASEDAEVNQIVRRILPAIAMSGAPGGDAAVPTPAERDRLARDLEQAQLHARTLALLKAVPIVTEAARAESFGQDLGAATAWLQGLLPEDVLTSLYTAVVGESPSVAAARAVRFI